MRKFILPLITLLFSFSIFAHGPTPQKVQESITVNIAPAEAWSILKDYSDFKKIMKVRSFDDEIMKIKYELLSKDVPFSDYNAYIIVKKGSNDNESVIQWTARFYRTYKLNPPIPEDLILLPTLILFFIIYSTSVWLVINVIDVYRRFEIFWGHLGPHLDLR